MKLLIITLCFASFIHAATLKVKIKGMTCEMCVKAITTELNKTNKCDKVDVSLENKEAIIVEKKDTTLTDEEIKKAIKRAGYQAMEIQGR